MLALGVAGAVSAARRQTGAFAGPALIGLALALAGFATAQLRTLNVEAPVLPRGSVYTSRARCAWPSRAATASGCCSRTWWSSGSSGGDARSASG